MHNESVSILSDTKVAIWDLDGTLLDSFGIFEELIADIVPDFELELPAREKLLANYHGSLEDTIASIFGSDLDKRAHQEFVAKFLSSQDSRYSEVQGYLFEDALDLSSRLSLAGIKQLVVTNRGHEGRGNASPRRIVEQSTLIDHIGHIICGDEVEVRKPDKAVLGTLLDEWGVDPSQVVVIGDQHVDAQLALNLGSQGIIVARDGAKFQDEFLADPMWQQHISVVPALNNVTVG